MSKVITFSRTFPAYHPKAGEPTFFVEKFWRSISECGVLITQIHDVLNVIGKSKDKLSDFDPKHHTIRAGKRWKVGDKFSPRVWSGKPYNSKQIIIAPDVEIKKVWDFTIKKYNDGAGKPAVFIDFGNYALHEAYHGDHSALLTLAKNDGLELHDLFLWFKYPKPFVGQIICWNENINY